MRGPWAKNHVNPRKYPALPWEEGALPPSPFPQPPPSHCGGEGLYLCQPPKGGRWGVVCQRGAGGRDRCGDGGIVVQKAPRILWNLRTVHSAPRDWGGPPGVMYLPPPPHPPVVTGGRYGPRHPSPEGGGDLSQRLQRPPPSPPHDPSIAHTPHARHVVPPLCLGIGGRDGGVRPRGTCTPPAPGAR